MADLAIVEGGVVVNRILGEPGFADGIECGSEVGIGWTYDGTDFTAPPLPEPEPQEPEMLPHLSARQLRLGLVAASILPSQVDAAIAAIPDDAARAVAEIEWEYASQFERDHPLIEQVGTALGLTTEQIDAMWQAALAL